MCVVWHRVMESAWQVAGRAASLWGVLGVAAMLMNAVKRVVPVALEPFRTLRRRE